MCGEDVKPLGGRSHVSVQHHLVHRIATGTALAAAYCGQESWLGAKSAACQLNAMWLLAHNPLSHMVGASNKRFGSNRI